MEKLLFELENLKTEIEWDEIDLDGVHNKLDELIEEYNEKI